MSGIQAGLVLFLRTGVAHNDEPTKKEISDHTVKVAKDVGPERKALQSGIDLLKRTPGLVSYDSDGKTLTFKENGDRFKAYDDLKVEIGKVPGILAVKGKAQAAGNKVLDDITAQIVQILGLQAGDLTGVIDGYEQLARDMIKERNQRLEGTKVEFEAIGGDSLPKGNEIGSFNNPIAGITLDNFKLNVPSDLKEVVAAIREVVNNPKFAANQEVYLKVLAEDFADGNKAILQQFLDEKDDARLVKKLEADEKLKNETVAFLRAFTALTVPDEVDINPINVDDKYNGPVVIPVGGINNLGVPEILDIKDERIKIKSTGLVAVTDPSQPNAQAKTQPFYRVILEAPDVEGFGEREYLLQKGPYFRWMVEKEKSTTFIPEMMDPYKTDKIQEKVDAVTGEFKALGKG